MKFHKYVLISILISIFEAKAATTIENIQINEEYINLIKTNLNLTINPCDDFYEYTCGNWYRNYNGTEYVDMPGYMDNKVNLQFGEILNKLKNKSGVYEKLTNVYEACTNLETLALNPFLLMTQDELEMQWPIYALDEGNWKNQTHFDWLKTVAILRKYGLNGIFLTQNINVQPTNGSHFVLELTQHQVSSTLDFNEVEDIFINFGLYHNESHKLTEELIKFENDLKLLAKVKYVNETEERKYSDNFKMYTLEELQKLLPDIDVIKYFEIILKEFKNVENLKELPIQTFALNLEFYKNLNQLFAKTSNETLAYYIMFKFMFYVNENLPQSRPKECIKYLRGHMSVFMNFLYEQFEFKSKRDEMELSLFKIFNNLKLEFQELVKENHLKLNKKEQEFILKELETMKLKIGNLPSNCTEKFIETFYQNLFINKTDFFQNHLNILKFLQHLEFAKLENKFISIENKIYDLEPSTLASSSPVKIFDNAILIPYGYLQMPLFDHRLKEIYQYSHFGFILAHEIIHAFDLFHIIYDHQSNYNYLGSQIATHYWPYMQCYAHSPNDILSETIADISGLRLAYRSYQHLINDVDDFTFLNLTKEQFFFINSVQFLCANIVKIADLELLNLDLSHDMHDTRVRQNWANYEEFAKVFECSENSTMYSKETCRLW